MWHQLNDSAQNRENLSVKIGPAVTVYISYLLSFLMSCSNDLFSSVSVATSYNCKVISEIISLSLPVTSTDIGDTNNRPPFSLRNIPRGRNPVPLLMHTTKPSIWCHIYLDPQTIFWEGHSRLFGGGGTYLAELLLSIAHSCHLLQLILQVSLGKISLLNLLFHMQFQIRVLYCWSCKST